ncbi:MAG TPA: ABC transporter permease [Chloroflexota bacterium]|nr:ABC transporter permease [Chloroflexota bacterium]
MIGYVAKRLLALLPIWLVLSILSFSLLHLAGGSPAAVILGVQATPAQIAQLNAQMGLDLPLPVQYLKWLSGVLHGDFGQSFFLNSAVAPAVVSHFSVTLTITLLGFVVAIVVGVMAGVIAAVRRGSVIDAMVTVISSLGFAIPEFLLGLLLILFLAVSHPLFPVQGYVAWTTSPTVWLAHVILPSFTLGFTQAGPLARITRTSLLRVLSADYVRTARAKGCSPLAVIFRHALASALLPVLTGIGLIFTALLGGAFATEVVFNLPGLGELMLNSALHRDFPTLQGGVLFIGTLILLTNLAVDIAYALADPRIRYG